MHVLLPVILVLGSALSPKSKPEDTTPILDIIPLVTTDLDATGGGNRNVRTAPPQFNQPIIPPPPSQPQRSTAKVQERVDDPDPPKDSAEESFEPRKENHKKLPTVPTTLTTRRNPNAPKVVARKSVDDSAERQANELRKKLAQEVGSAANDLRDHTATTVKFTDGFGGNGTDGIPYGNFLAAVKSIYARAWIVPDGVEDDEATTEVSVTIARDGNVLNAIIIGRSGNSLVDHSVQMTIERVRFVAPLPPTSKDDQRTVTIGFNVKAKRGI